MARLTPNSANARLLQNGREAVKLATVRALNDVAFQAQRDIQQHMRAVFDRPSPGLLRSVVVTKASVNDSTPVATVALTSKDPAFAKRLTALGRLQEQGGTLRPADIGRKRLAVPVAATLDAYGGLGRGGVAKLMRLPGTFVAKVGTNRNAGLYQRLPGGNVRLLVSFQKATRYRHRMDFEGVAQRAGLKLDDRLRVRLEQPATRGQYDQAANPPAPAGGGGTSPARTTRPPRPPRPPRAGPPRPPARPASRSSMSASQRAMARRRAAARASGSP